MDKIKTFSDFHNNTEKATGLEEGKDVAVLDMGDAAKTHIDEIENAFNAASDELYSMKKMADDIVLEYPEMSKDILEVVEPMMSTLEREFPNQLRTLLKKFGHDPKLHA